MNRLFSVTGLGAAFIVLQEPTPGLTFYPTAPEQPPRVEGVPAWRDSVFVRHDTLIVRHLREQRVYTKLLATLQSDGTKLQLRVVEDAGPRGHDGGVPAALSVRAYEARIAPLVAGVYTLILRDEGFGFALKPFTLRRVIRIPEPDSIVHLFHGWVSPMNKPVREIVTDASRWDEVRKVLQVNAGKDSTLPSVDFSQHMVVLAALGERSSTGHNIVVDSIATTKSNYLVFVSATASEGCIGGGMIVRPVDVAQVPRSTLPIRFVERIVTHRC